MSLADRLSQGLAALGLDLPAHARDKLLAYLRLLAKWNRTYNLTAVRGEDEMLTHHLLDSLAVLSHLGALHSLADVGSGAGLPGLVLAIARPDLQLTSIEAVQKKAAFQQQAKIELELSNVSIYCGRVEQATGHFDAVISRAFSSLADFVAQAGHLSSRLLAMKGLYPAEEIAALPTGWKVSRSDALTVPGLDAQRHLLVLEKT